jgi:hypothetical protein
VKSTVASMQTQSDSVKTRSRHSCRVHQNESAVNIASNSEIEKDFESPSTAMNKRASSPSSSSSSTQPAKKLDYKMSAPTKASFLVQRLSDKAKLPTRGSPLAAGYDLYAFVLHFPPQHLS